MTDLTAKAKKFVFQFGVNKAAEEVLTASVLGVLVITQSENVGGYMDPNNIDGFMFNPADGLWYPSSSGPPFQLGNPVESSKQVELNKRQRDRELHNNVEQLSSASGESGTYDAPTLSQLLRWLPEISKYIWDSMWEGRLLTVEERMQKSKYADPGIDINVKRSFNNSQRWTPRRDPLVFDLNGNGLDTVGINVDNPLMFDLDGDGVKTSTGWVGSDDGFLVIDVNKNGIVDNGTELFGDATALHGGGKAVDGFAALAQEDSNADGMVDQLDTKWNDLRIWRDLNQDGQSQSGELFSLSSLNIVNIKVQKTENSIFLPNGNEIADLGSYTKADGSNGTVGEVGKVVDINLIEDTFNSQFQDSIPLAPGVSVLPNVKGSGVVRNLREAASLDTVEGRALKIKLENFLAATSYTSQHVLLEDLIVAWGATGNFVTSTINNQSPEIVRRFNTLEKFNGVTIFAQRINVDIEDGRKEMLNKSWQVLSDSIYKALVAQTRFKPLLDKVEISANKSGPYLDLSKVGAYFQQSLANVSVDKLGDLIEFNKYFASYFADPNWIGYKLLENIVRSTPITEEIRQLYLNLGVVVEGNQSIAVWDVFTSKIIFGGNINQVINAGMVNDMIFGGSGNEILNGFDGDDMISGGAGDDKLSGGNGDDSLVGENGEDRLDGMDGNDALSGGAGNDLLSGGIGNDNLSGGDGNDNLFGDTGADRLDGGAGDDTLSGGIGTDKYVFSRNSDKDIIHDNGNSNGDSDGFDTLEIDHGVLPSDVSIGRYRNSEDLTLSIEGSASEVLIKGYFSANGNSQIEKIQFKDGTTWGLDFIKSYLLQTRTNDGFIFGFDTDDVINGSDETDYIYSDRGNDVIYGGLGDDYLVGGVGSDVYKFGRYFGRDFLDEQGDSLPNSSVDTILFAPGIAPADVSIRRNSSNSNSNYYDNLVLTIKDTGSILSIHNYFTQSGLSPNGIEKIQFADGTVWNYNNVKIALGIGTEEIDNLNGTNEDDVMKGFSGDDYITADRGNDVIDGGLGDDFLEGGDGSDIYLFGRNSGNDQIRDYPELNNSILEDVDVIKLDVDIVPADVTIRRDDLSDDLLLTINGTTSVLKIKNTLAENGQHRDSIEEIRFADGTVWNVAQIKAKVLTGTNGVDSLIGFSGPDLLDGLADNDYLDGREGSDTYKFGRNSGNDIIEEKKDLGINTDTILLDSGITPDDIKLIREINTHDLLITILDSPNYLRVKKYFDDFSGNGRYIEKIQFADGTVWDVAGVKEQLLRGTTGNDTLIGTGDDDILNGREGADELLGNEGSDVYKFGKSSGVDLIQEMDSDANDTDIVLFDSSILPSDVVISNVNNHLHMTFNGSSSTLTIQSFFVEVEGNNTRYHGIEKFQFSDGTIWDRSTVVNMSFVGTSGADNISGDEYDNVIDGLSGNDEIYGRGGNDILLGGGGDDYLRGGYGNDILKGGPGNDTLVGNEGADVFEFGKQSGNDLIQDHYGAEAASDSIVLDAGILPTDILLKRQSYDLILNFVGGQNSLRVANFFLDTDTGNEFEIGALKFADGTVWDSARIKQEVLSNTNKAPTLASPITDQSASQNILFNFTFSGATFVDPNVGDTLSYRAELASGGALPSWLKLNSTTRTFSGTPTVAGIVSVKLFAKDNAGLEVFDVFDIVINPGNQILNGTSAADVLNGATGNDSLYGLAGNDRLTGNSGNDLLDGGIGSDTLIGGLGDDTYIVDSTMDVVTENLNEGTDTVKSSVTLTLPTNVENLILTGTTAINGTGNALNNVLTGNSAVNALDGGVGADTLIGAAGNDNYTVDNLNDVIVENANEGTDQVNSSVTYTLSVNVENLTLTGSSNINATGNAAANVLTGNAGNNVLDGGAGNDSMVGGAGNDTYVVDSSSDTITEATSAGTDLVQSSVSYTLGTNLENLTLTGTANINATGNTAANILFGNSGNNVLDGGTGADTMTGGAGNDIYVRDNASDVITENANEGIDQVKSSLTYTLISNLEALMLAGSTAINGTGNDLDNLLTGNSGKNVLNGGDGNDILQGAAGDDTLTDTAGKNIFDGGAGIDVITAGIGNDFIAGGLGNDTITTGTGVDVVAFNRGDGMDTLVASTGKDNTLSLGKGIKYADLLFKKSGNDLILVTGTSEQVTMKDWYTNVNNRSIANLQIVIEGTTDYNAASTNKLNNKKIGQFNFDGLAAKFDQARASNPSLTSWALSSSLLEFYLAGSDTSAIGGDLAYQYAKVGNLSGFSMIPALNIISNAQYGSTSQTLQPVSSLKDTTVSLV